MSQENVEIVHAFLDAGCRGDTEGFMAALDPRIEWTPVKDDPDYRVHRGLDDVATWLSEWTEIFPDMRWEPERIVDAGGDLVVASVRAFGRGSDTGLDVGTEPYGVIFALRDGQIVRIDESQTETALKEIGLAE
jgi:ketosteroid isomerase-like protein